MRTWRTVRLLGSLVVAAGLLLPSHSRAATDAVRVSLPDTLVPVAPDLRLPVRIDSPVGVDIYSMTMTMTYDPAVLQATDVSLQGTVASEWSYSHNLLTPGTIVLSLANSQRLSQGGVLAYLVFTGVGMVGSTTSLSFTSLDFNEGTPGALTADGRAQLVAVPQAAFTGNPLTGTAPLTVQFADNSSGLVAAWSWSFGDNSTSTVQHPSHAYANPGTYTVALTVTGPGGTSTFGRTNYVTANSPAPPPTPPPSAPSPPPPPPPPPVASFNLSPESGLVPLTVGFVNTSTNASDCEWYLPGGRTVYSTNLSPQTFDQAGTYTVRLRAYRAGTYSETQQSIRVLAKTQARFEVSSTKIAAGGTVSFADASVGEISSWSWSFGDGQTSTQSAPTHTYAAPGTYTVTLTASGPGGTSTATRDGLIQVVGPLPSISPAIPGSTTDEDNPISVTLTGYERDELDGPAALRWSAAVLEGADLLAAYSTDGGAGDQFTFRPQPNLFGKVRVKFTLSNSRGGSAAQEVVLTWLSQPDPPVVSTPAPADGAGIALLSVVLSWKTTDADPGDVVSYEVRLGTAGTPDVVVAREYRSTSVLVPDLAGQQTYSWQVVAKDASGVSATSPVWRFSTLADSKAPTVTLGPAALGIMTDQATVQWTTDEAGTGVVDYSDKPDLSGALQVSDPKLTTEHSVTLTKLLGGTTYHYRVRSQDAARNASAAKGGQFKTLMVADVLPPKILTGPAASGIMMDQAMVQWSTDEASSSVVEYGLQADFADARRVAIAELTMAHSVPLSGLQAGTAYFYRVHSLDAANNVSVLKAGQFKTLAAADLLPPKILNGPAVAGIMMDQATVQWRTDEASTSIVEYGTTPDLGVVQVRPERVVDHTVVLTGLAEKTKYFYRVLSGDASENVTRSQQGSLTTLATPDLMAPRILTGPIATGISDLAGTINWTTDEVSTTRVEYGLLPGLADAQTAESAKAVLTHVVSLTNLTAATVYQFRITSTDISGNTSPPKTGSFRTLATPDVLPPRITNGPAALGITDQSAQIEWKTDEDAEAVVDYGAGTLDQAVQSVERGRRHSLALTNLLPATTYVYRVSVADLAGNRTVGTQATFTTLAKPDLSPPVITGGPVVTTRLHDQAVIEWSTDELSDGEVAYGLTAGYGSTAGTSERTNRHSVRLTNLQPGTTYQYQVRSTDASNNGPTRSTGGTFTTKTAPDNTPPRIAGVPVVQGRTDVSARIAWTTDELADSFVEYGAGFQQTAGSEEGVLQHAVQLTNLQPGTIYPYRVRSTDLAGNGPVYSQSTVSFNTKVAPDVLPPVIVTSPSVTTSSPTSATVSWKTDEPSDSRVAYGQTQEYGAAEVKPEYVTAHVVDLSNLLPATLYHFQVGSVDGSNNGPALSRDLTFRTLAAADVTPPQLLSGPTVRNVTSTSAAIEWFTDEPANSILDFGNVPAYEAGHLEQGERVKEHVVHLTDLQPATAYHFKVSSTDASGNSFTTDPQGRHRHSKDNVFRTLREQDRLPPVFLEGPIIYVRDENAVVQWFTDEPAGYEIVYDTAPTLDGARRDVIQDNELSVRHSARLTRLQRGKQYYYRLTVWDQEGNSRAATNTKRGGVAKLAQVASDGSFVTLVEADTRPPVLLGAPQATAKTTTSLTIEWDTDELSDSFVEFAQSGGSLDQSEGSTQAATHHRVVLSNLSPGLAYDYRVSSTDLSGNGPVRSTQLLGQTQAEQHLTPPRLLGEPQVLGLTDRGATIGWTTDELSTSTVEYGAGELDRRRDDPDLTVQHRVTITNLTPGTAYRYQVSSIDGSLNGPVVSTALTLQTLAAPDLVPPKITDSPRLVSRTNRMATLSWATDELADGFVKYGTRSDSLKLSAGAALNTLVHRVALTNLAPATTYFYRVGSIDLNNNGPTESHVYQFTTAAFADTIPPATPAGLSARSGSQSVWVSWKPSADAGPVTYNVYRRQVFSLRRLDGEGTPPFSPVSFLANESPRVVGTQLQEPGFLDQGLTNGVMYKYQVTAVDDAFPPNESPWSPMITVVPAAGSALRAPVVRGAVANPQRTTLEVFNVTAGPTAGQGTLTYAFEVSTDSLFSEPVVSAGGVPAGSGGSTTWSFARPLVKGQTYWWRARATDGLFDGLWMSPASFAVTGTTGDFNGDQVVDFQDFFRLADYFGRKTDTAGWDPSYDLDGSGSVDFGDFFIFADHFGEGRQTPKANAPSADAVAADLQVQLRLVDLTPQSFVLSLEIGSPQLYRGYGAILRHPSGVALQSPSGDLRVKVAGEATVLEGLLRETPERTWLTRYGLAADAALTGTPLQLHFSLPPEALGGEVVLEELWVVDTQGRARQLVDGPAVRLTPRVFSLSPPYPNPFNPAIQLPYALAERTPVKLQVFNVLGQQVRALVDQVQEAGFYRAHWEGTDGQGTAVASGVYFIRLEAGAFVSVRKIAFSR